MIEMNTVFQSIQHEAFPSSVQAETKLLMHVVLDQSESCLDVQHSKRGCSLQLVLVPWPAHMQLR
jgi:hypothetical protein